MRKRGRCLMRNFKPLLTSGLVIGVCLFSAMPAMARGTHNRVFKIAPNAASTPQITALRQTDKGLADQLVSLKQDIQTQRKADWAQNNSAGLNALLTATSDQSTMAKDYTTALTDSLNLEKDMIQLQIDIQATNATNISTDQNNVIADLNNQITDRNQLITDDTKILTDLGGSVITPTVTPAVTPPATNSATTSATTPVTTQTTTSALDPDSMN